MLTELDASMLAEAFPREYLSVATSGAQSVARALASAQWTERFTVRSERQGVLIPARLRFASEKLLLTDGDAAFPFARALQTRSNDGFERQSAARDLMRDLQPWGAPFVVALIGEYIVEILDDIAAALTPDSTRMLGDFIIDNEAYWQTTKQRVASYWNVYYRANAGSEQRRPYGRNEYTGFKLVERIEAAAPGHR
jgi:hypothetical protein